VSAQIVVRRATDSTLLSKVDLERSLFAKSSPSQKKLYVRLKKRFTKDVSNTIMMPCKSYVGFGNRKKYVVIKPDRQDGLVVGMATIGHNLL
jgi:Domain of unknown function (DUF5655)